MLDRLEAINAKYTDLGVSLTNPEVIGDNKKFTAISKEYRSLEKIVTAYHAYNKLLGDLEFNKEVLNSDDAEMRDMAKQKCPN